jgi:hypothetical protein
MGSGEIVSLTIWVTVFCALVVFAVPVTITILIIRHRRRMAQISRSPAGQSVAAKLEALCVEVANLRETTTQFDMSVERTLTEMQHRITILEAAQQRSSAGASPPTIHPTAQTIEAGRQTSG